MRAGLQTLIQEVPGLELMTARAGLLQRKCDCDNHALSGNCDECAKKKSLVQIHATVITTFGSWLRPKQVCDLRTRDRLHGRLTEGKGFGDVLPPANALGARATAPVRT